MPGDDVEVQWRTGEWSLGRVAHVAGNLFTVRVPGQGAIASVACEVAGGDWRWPLPTPAAVASERASAVGALGCQREHYCVLEDAHEGACSIYTGAAPRTQAELLAERRNGAPALEVCPYSARAGFRMVRCQGEAHTNGHVDNCDVCSPRWGWVEMPEPAAPAVRYCGAAIVGTDFRGRPLGSCRTVLDGVAGDVAPCTVCKGTRCSVHCASVDHYRGAEIISDVTICPPSEHRREYRARLVRVGGYFHGDVSLLNELGVPSDVHAVTGGRDSDVVQKSLYAKVDELAARVLAARLPYVAPTVREISRAEALGETDRFDVAPWIGITPGSLARMLPGLIATCRGNVRRPFTVASLSKDLEMLCLNADEAWRELEELAETEGTDAADFVGRARVLAEAFACQVLSLMAGGLS